MEGMVKSLESEVLLPIISEVGPEALEKLSEPDVLISAICEMAMNLPWT